MINLFVDDVRDPSPYREWVVVRTVEEAMAMLATGDVDECSLDHDMGACDVCTRAGVDVGDMTTPETTYMHWCPHVLDGTKLVRWMVETGYWSKCCPTVHSANPVGADRMRKLIVAFFGDSARGPMFY